MYVRQPDKVKPSAPLAPGHLQPRASFTGRLSLRVSEPLHLVAFFYFKTLQTSPNPLFSSLCRSSFSPTSLCRSISHNRVSLFAAAEKKLEEASEFQFFFYFFPPSVSGRGQDKDFFFFPASVACGIQVRDRTWVTAVTMPTPYLTAPQGNSTGLKMDFPTEKDYATLSISRQKQPLCV